ncbi:DUF302 domain-containing protein [Thioalkalivibrio sp.]|uniref:DUF302 domain-containing protein n=1 Tax=Thioalkalivibrio sp. TaxID=2093813 RepID=UPI003569CA6B
MRLVRNLLALVGLLALVALAAAILAFEPYVNKARGLDGSALGVYTEVAKTVLRTGDAMEALVYRRQVVPGRDASDVERSLEQAAADLGLESLGMLPVQQEIRSRLRDDFPLLQVYLFCDPHLAVDLMRHNPATAAYLPCRVTLYEESAGDLWVMVPNLDLVLHGSRPLPLALQERAAGLQAQLREMVDRAAGTQGADARNEPMLGGFTS